MELAEYRRRGLAIGLEERLSKWRRTLGPHTIYTNGMLRKLARAYRLCQEGKTLHEVRRGAGISEGTAALIVRWEASCKEASFHTLTSILGSMTEQTVALLPEPPEDRQIREAVEEANT